MQSTFTAISRPPKRDAAGHRPSRVSWRAPLRLGLIAAVIAVPVLVAPVSTAASEHSAGLARLAVPYFDTTIDVAVWYPASGEEKRLDAGPFSPTAAAGAELGSGKHPMVLLSHGTGGMNLNHHPIAAALARAGYVVAAPTHPGDNFRDRNLIADSRYWSERPRQLSVVLDALLADARFGDEIDQQRIGAIGHSAGGYSVAAIVGMRPDVSRLAGHCQDSDDPSCRFKDPSAGVTNPLRNPFALPDGYSPNADIADLRIRSAVLLAPMAAVFSPKYGPLPGVKLLMIHATHDEILPSAHHADHLRQIAPSITVEVAQTARHFSFIAPVDEQWKSRLGAIAQDPADFDRKAFQDSLMKRLTAWFDSTLAAR